MTTKEPFDLDAPIVPGEAAAGVRVGDEARDIVESTGLPLLEDPPDRMRVYTFGSVLLWVKGARVQQIGVVQRYRGRIQDKIGLGSTIAEVESALGTVIEDDEDYLVVPAVPGWSFETEQWSSDDELQQNRFARIQGIYVFGGARPEHAH